MYREPQHPSWCSCRRCEARELVEEMRALDPLEPDEPQIVSPEIVPAYTDMEADSDRELELARRAYEGDPREQTDAVGVSW